MTIYTVEVIIQNKPAARDPEGETIQKDLVYRGGYNKVKSIRSGKYLKIDIESESPDEAKDKVFEMCNELRIFNPVVHTCTTKIKD
ncbi:MAG: phosphoribosylformylglycinamidine synthase subunit PurS [Candidatus Lokiarchaeota archaeon]|nr:phosphoribosylformylglycinamidine synthase subunit PurS [Candidatus Lokiarchaeota archaeon]